MPITNFTTFCTKYKGKGTSAADIATAEGCTVAEAQEAKDFLLQHFDFKVDLLAKMWDAAQYNKAHPYIPPAGGTPTGFGASSVVQRTVAGIPEGEFWVKQEALIEAVVRRVLATPR